MLFEMKCNAIDIVQQQEENVPFSYENLPGRCTLGTVRHPSGRWPECASCRSCCCDSSRAAPVWYLAKNMITYISDCTRKHDLTFGACARVRACVCVRVCVETPSILFDTNPLRVGASAPELA